MSGKAKSNTELNTTLSPVPGPVGCIQLAARNVWHRVFREKRNKSISIWPDYSLIFIVAAATLIPLAAYFDGDIAHYMAGPRHNFLEFLRSITDAAKTHYYLIPALLIMTIISAHNWQARSLSGKKLFVRAYERAAFVFIAIAVPGIFTNIVKQIVGRGRPHTLEEFGAYTFSPFEFEHAFQSFPSGHATAAGSLGMIIALYYPAFRWPALISAGFLAFARAPANAHYLSDIVAGYMIGTFATLVFARWLASRAMMFTIGASNTFPQLKN